MKISLLQLNLTVGDLVENSRRIADHVLRSDADLCITSEMAMSGYPPRDLLFNADFIRRTQSFIQDLAKRIKDGPALLIGGPEEIPESPRRLFNTAYLLKKGQIRKTFRKKLLPNYDVFDEVRYFKPAHETNIFDLAGCRIGVTICEDIWNDIGFWTEYRYEENPVATLAEKGIDLLVNLSASPFSLGKQKLREEMMGTIARRHSIAFCYVNQVGGNDDLIFDGRSCVFDSRGNLKARGHGFEEDILTVDFDNLDGPVRDDDFTTESEAWKALVLGTRDYIRKSGFEKAHLGLSGGIDSSLTAAIVTEGLGPEKVLGVLLPSPFSSPGSLEDAHELAENLKIKTITLPIGPIMKSFEDTLAPAFAGFKPDVTEENLQARIRGNLLMALSNKYGSMLITTGNKSELAVGYCTIYGDMSGGFAAISDVPKTLVYDLCRWLNRTRGPLIPETVLTKPPSAELRPDQTDQDSLPPYDFLDEVLKKIIESYASVDDLVDEGYDRQLIEDVMAMIRRAEFKRKQTPPGIKITDRAFGTGWRMPIACRITP